HDAYVPGMLASETSRGDALGQLARVFDRVVRGLRSREERLKHRVRRLKGEWVSGSVSVTEATWGDTSPFTKGQVIGGRFEIVAQIGRGGMGTVYQARDLALKEDVALKALRPDLVQNDPRLVDRLKSEIRLARRLSHENVLRSHDLGEADGT